MRRQRSRQARSRSRTRDAAPSSWLTFVALAASAATAQVFIVRTGRSHGFHTAIVFVTAGALLLPPELVALMVVVQHVPEWLKERYPAYIQTFNIFNFALAALAAWAVADLGAPSGFLGTDTRAAAAGVAAGALLVLVNHVLLAPMLRLARGVSFADSGLFSAESLSSDIVLAGLGVVLAMVWLVERLARAGDRRAARHLVPLDPPARAARATARSGSGRFSKRRRSA